MCFRYNFIKYYQNIMKLRKHRSKFHYEYKTDNTMYYLHSYKLY